MTQQWKRARTCASLVTAAILLAACGGTASRSAGHGGHEHTAPIADPASMPGMDHSTMAGMDHSNMAGMQHGAPSAPVAVLTDAPRSSAEMARIDPGATLRPDGFDAPAPASVAEAAKAAGDGGHAGHEMKKEQ